MKRYNNIASQLCVTAYINVLGAKANFTEQEMKKFTTRYENGYDLKSDERYNLWLKVYHPESHTTINRQSGI